jgi:hypothetical protein
MEMAVLDQVREVEHAGLGGITGRDDYVISKSSSTLMTDFSATKTGN